MLTLLDKKGMPKRQLKTASDVISACEALGFVASRVSGGVVVKVISWKEFKDSLPKEGARNEIDIYYGIINYLKTMIGDDLAKSIKNESGRFTIWSNGTFRCTITIRENRRSLDSD